MKGTLGHKLRNPKASFTQIAADRSSLGLATEIRC